MSDIKLGEPMAKKQMYRRMNEKGTVLFHVLDQNVKKTVTFFDDNKKPVRETDPKFAERMAEWEEIKRLKYNAKQAGIEDEIKRLDELAFRKGASTKYFVNIINRGTEEKEVLEMTPGAYNQINDLFLKGYTTVSHDFTLENTGEKGIGRYKVLPAPVKKPLTEKELKASEMGMVEAVDSSDIPF